VNMQAATEVAPMPTLMTRPTFKRLAQARTQLIMSAFPQLLPAAQPDWMT